MSQIHMVVEHRMFIQQSILIFNPWRHLITSKRDENTDGSSIYAIVFPTPLIKFDLQIKHYKN